MEDHLCSGSLAAFARQVANFEIPVLITGETGTGKTTAAQSIHRLSDRSHERFIHINCASIPEQLVEAELFGVERGAFTGATGSRAGHLEIAGSGTILFDEIGEISLPVQAKLLRVLEEGEFERLGSTRTRRFSARVISATSRDLSSAIQRREFRSDLYYRLAGAEVALPPLRERPEDIRRIAQSVWDAMSKRYGRAKEGVPEAVMAQLTSSAWPGNIRELKSAVYRAFIGLDPVRRTGPAGHSELDELCEALAAARGNVSLAARKLGVARSTLRYRMMSYGLDRETFRPAGRFTTRRTAQFKASHQASE